MMKKLIEMIEFINDFLADSVKFSWCDVSVLFYYVLTHNNHTHWFYYYAITKKSAGFVFAFLIDSTFEIQFKDTFYHILWHKVQMPLCWIQGKHQYKLPSLHQDILQSDHNHLGLKQTGVFSQKKIMDIIIEGKIIRTNQQLHFTKTTFA